MFIFLPTSEVQGMKTKLRIGVYSGDRLVEEVKTVFVGPMPGTS
jgi:hypothetical protein